MMTNEDYDYGTVVYFHDSPDVPDGTIIVRCAWCDWWTDSSIGLRDANDCRIDHENEHGIYMDPDTGAMWYDPSENERGGGPA